VKELMSTKRDKAWFDGLWNVNAGNMRAYLQRRVQPSDVDDLLSEVFVVAWRHRDRKPNTELPWLYGIGRKVVSTHYRGAQRRDDLEAKLDHEPTALADEFARSDLRSEIADALAALGHDDRELLLLTAWEGLTPKEIAVATGSNSPAVRMRLSRARSRFEQALLSEPHVKGAQR
jgi:RNA polymerase sigma-70 factor (ECF subfamily)